MTDRLVPQFGHAPVPTDPVFRATEDYLRWVAAHLPAAWDAQSTWGLFNVLAATLLVVYVVWGVAMYYRSYWAQLAGHRVMLDLRTDLFQHIQRLSHSFFLSRQSGGIVSRLTADIALAQNFVGAAMTNIWMDVVACLFYLALLLADERPAHHRGPGGVPALHRLHAHLREGLQAHLQAGAGGDGGVLRRHAGAHRRLHAGEELRRRAARGARLLLARPRPARAGDGQRAHHQPVQHASCSG